jgi:uncharacterized protein (UPF0335 family)
MAGSGHNSGIGGIAAEALGQYVDRIERLEEEKKALLADIKSVYDEAKSTGFDAKILRKIVAERRKSEADRQEEAAIMDLYRGALGMLNGTPLGNAAIRRLTGHNEPREAPYAPSPLSGGSGKPEPVEPDVTEAVAREQGKEAALAGKPVTDNRFPAHDPRRAAWDEGWCSVQGTGMEIPPAWRRTPKAKKGGTPNGDAAAAAPADGDDGVEGADE